MTATARRVAVVDVGTNSTRLLIADVAADRQITELDRRTTVTRLGAGVDHTGRLADEAMQRVFGVLATYRDAIDAHVAGDAVAILTSAVRDARNGPEFARAIRDRFALDARTISGDEEARLTFAGATSGRKGDKPLVVIDIGGGSTELVVGRRGAIDDHASTQAGVVRQTERHLHTDPPSQAELDALAQEVREVVAKGVPPEQRRAVRHAIAVAGTATSLGAIAQKLEPYDPEKVHGYLLSYGECERILGELAKLPLERRREVPGLHPDRAPTIVAGVIILLQTLELFDLEEFEVSEHDILRGAALGLDG
jgi:exopolyphosphatase/guanosine-5'-triphosphate,3'-diphosphate pyrophosphatase